jgi:hypothetical protein
VGGQAKHAIACFAKERISVFAILVEKVVGKSHRSVHVISDLVLRFTFRDPSSMFYGVATGGLRPVLRSLSYMATGGLRPVLVNVLCYVFVLRTAT